LGTTCVNGVDVEPGRCPPVSAAAGSTGDVLMYGNDYSGGHHEHEEKVQQKKGLV
jgi:hypothetical protein